MPLLTIISHTDEQSFRRVQNMLIVLNLNLTWYGKFWKKLTQTVAAINNLTGNHIQLVTHFVDKTN